MKKIEAVIKPFKLEEVREALADCGVTGRDLAQMCREYPAIVRIPLWLAAEVMIIACDLAEVIGSAIALQLLFNIRDPQLGPSLEKMLTEDPDPEVRKLARLGLARYGQLA